MEQKKDSKDSQKEIFSETGIPKTDDYDYVREDTLYPKIDDDQESDLSKDINWFDF